MKRQKDIEIYLKNCSNKQIIDWIKSILGLLKEPEDSGVGILCSTPIGLAIITSEIDDNKSITGVWFNTPQSPWPTDVDCGRQAAQELGCIVFCDPGEHYPEVDPVSYTFLKIDRNNEQLVSWVELDES